MKYVGTLLYSNIHRRSQRVHFASRSPQNCDRTGPFQVRFPTKDHYSHFRHAALSVELGEGFKRKGNPKVWTQYKDFEQAGSLIPNTLLDYPQQPFPSASRKPLREKPIMKVITLSTALLTFVTTTFAVSCKIGLNYCGDELRDRGPRLASSRASQKECTDKTCQVILKTSSGPRRHLRVTEEVV